MTGPVCWWRVCSEWPPRRGSKSTRAPATLGRLLELFEGADRVVLVDAARGPGAPGTAEAVPLDAAQPLPIQSTHGLGLAEALGVASELDIW